MEAKVSIVIAVYNEEQYIRECLDSALCQTVSNKEIICVDDGSTDNSLNILREYAEKYDGIVVIEQVNKGAGAARNAGILAAQGEYVCFLDADDFYLDEEALDKMVQACKKHEAMICGSFRKDYNNKTKSYADVEMHRQKYSGDCEGAELNYRDYQDDLHYHSYIYNRTMLIKNQIFFPDYRRGQDPPFFLKAILQAEKIWILPIEFYAHRIGHKDFSVASKWVIHVLYGMRDNIRTAQQNNLVELQKKIIERINKRYTNYLIENLDRDTITLLMEIESYLLDKKLKIQLFDLMHTGKFKSKEEWSLLDKSLHMLKLLEEMHYRRIELSAFLQNELNISHVIVYGLGWSGEILYNELLGTDVEIVLGIDKSKAAFYNIPVTNDMKNIDMCVDAFIITPLLEQEEIAEELQRQTSIPCYGFLDILNRIHYYTMPDAQK